MSLCCIHRTNGQDSLKYGDKVARPPCGKHIQSSNWPQSTAVLYVSSPLLVAAVQPSVTIKQDTVCIYTPIITGEPGAGISELRVWLSGWTARENNNMVCYMLIPSFSFALELSPRTDVRLNLPSPPGEHLSKCTFLNVAFNVQHSPLFLLFLMF